MKRVSNEIVNAIFRDALDRSIFDGVDSETRDEIHIAWVDKVQGILETVFPTDVEK